MPKARGSALRKAPPRSRKRLVSGPATGPPKPSPPSASTSPPPSPANDQSPRLSPSPLGRPFLVFLSEAKDLLSSFPKIEEQSLVASLFGTTPNRAACPKGLSPNLWLSSPWSPDLAEVGADHRVAGLAGEGSGELLQIGGRADRAEAAERVRVGVDDQTGELRAVVGGPDPRPGQEETLVGRQPVDRRR